MWKHQISLVQSANLIHSSFSQCRPSDCKTISPVFEQMAKEYKKIMFVKVDVNSANAVATDCAIKELPTFQFYLRRDKIYELTGADKDALKQYLDSCVVKAELQKEFDDFDVSDSADY